MITKLNKIRLFKNVCSLISGAAASNYLLLSKKRRYIKRAIHMSGTSLSYFASSSANHLSLLYDLFAKELNNKKDSSKLKHLLKTISTDQIVNRTSTVFGQSVGAVGIFWTPVVESIKIFFSTFFLIIHANDCQFI